MTIIGIALILLPFASTWFILFKLAPYRRDGRGLVGTVLQLPIRALRPDLYTDEGQDLVRWLWVATVVTIPWVLLVANVFLG